MLRFSWARTWIRRTAAPVALVLAAALLAWPGAAEPLDYEATLRVVIPNLGIDVQNSASGATDVTPASGGAHFGLPPGIFTLGPVTGFSTSLSGTFQFDASNLTGGTFGMSGGLGPGFGGPMPLTGHFTHGNFLATHATSSGSTYLTTTTVALPVYPIGGGGSTSTSIQNGPSQTLTYFLFGDRFTTQPASNGTSMRTGFDTRTANGAGNIQMVAPFFTESSINAYSYGFAILDISFVPEPGRAVLLAASAGLLFVLGRRRSRN